GLPTRGLSRAQTRRQKKAPYFRTGPPRSTGDWQLGSVLQAQALVGHLADFPIGRRIVLQRGFTSREHLLQLARPGLGTVLLREAALEQIEHDRDRHRSARRSAEQRGDGAVLCCDKLGTELQNAALLRVFLDD